MKAVFRFLWHLPSHLLIAMVQGYQKYLSPDHSFWSKNVFPNGYCQFQPSCSQYMIDSLKKYGFLKGTLKGIYRILRCNPCSKGGHDPS